MSINYQELTKSPQQLLDEEREKSKQETEKYASMKLVEQWRRHPESVSLKKKLSDLIISITDQCEMEAMSASCNPARVQLDVVRIKTLKEVLSLIG